MTEQLLKELALATQLYLSMQNNPENYKVIEIHDQKRKLAKINDNVLKYIALNKI